jgi:tetratricopeptide (TPR) repeat protein
VAALVPRAAGGFGAELLEPVLEDWRREPSLSVAADVVSAAFSIGLLKEAREAADFVLADKDAPDTARQIALRCIAKSDTGPNPDFVRLYSQPAFPTLRQAIHNARTRLIAYPINPMLWTNLSLFYTTIGQPSRAERAMRIALELAPENRFVVRAACRLFLHIGDVEKAHCVLLGTSAVQHDPWVLAGEMAIADIRSRTSRFAKKATRMLETDSHSPFHLSELAATLATMEAREGNRKKAKKLCGQSLIDPAENAIAQVAWLSRRMGESLGSPPTTAQIKSSEANAWVASALGEWETSLREAKQWHNEQPFSSRSAIFVAHIASMALEDFSEAEQILRQGLTSNQDDATLFNNLAFALIQQGQIDEAADFLEQGSRVKATSRQKVCLTATNGLLEFRSGRIVQGRMLYRLASNLALAQSLEELSCIAKAYHAIEEVRSGTTEAAARKSEALEAVKRLRDPLCKLFTDKINRAKFASAIA